LVRQVLAESLLLAAGGAGFALLLAWGLTRALLAVAPPEAFGLVTQVSAIGVDWRVFGLAAFLALASGLLSGLAPAIRTSRQDFAAVFGRAQDGLSGSRGRQALLALQVALAVVLLVGTGLLVRSLGRVLGTALGFRVENVLTARISLPDSRYSTPESRAQFVRQLLDGVATLPGVTRGGAVNHLPLTSYQLMVRLGRDGRAMDEAGDPIPLATVTTDYFRTLDIRLRAGRYFDEHDAPRAEHVVILSSSAASRLFPGQDPLAQTLSIPADVFSVPSTSPARVVGVVEDVRHQGRENEGKPALYVPYDQSPASTMTLVLASNVAPKGLAEAVRTDLAALDPDLPLEQVMTMEQRVSDSLAARRFALSLFAAFAALGVFLACVGTYGVISTLVEQRTHEVGIRMALGALPRHLVPLLLRHGLAPLGLGLAVGLGVAVMTSRVMASLLYGITRTDPLTYGVVGLVEASVTLAACWLPMRRATCLNPVDALREL
jgi:predicted permease